MKHSRRVGSGSGGQGAGPGEGPAGSARGRRGRDAARVAGAVLVAALALRCGEWGAGWRTGDGAARVGIEQFAARDSAPYPPSPVLTGLRIDWSTHRREAQGSDNWALTWAADGHQYTSWGDGYGFERSRRESAISIGFSRIAGDKDDYAGTDVFYGDRRGSGLPLDAKSIGIVSVGGVLYSWLTPGSNVSNWERARLYRSGDRGATWTDTGVEYVAADGVGVPWILNFGRDYAGARDGYVYHYFIEIEDATRWEAQVPGEIALARSPIGGLEDRSSYEWFAGLAADGEPRWTAELAGRRPVLADPNGLMRGSIVYNAGLGRYLFVINHTARNEGNIAIFDGPEPWGPWTTVLYDYGWPRSGAVEQNTFLWQFSPRWWSADGRGFVLVFTGKQSNDSWNSVEGSFTTDRARANTEIGETAR